MAEKGDVVHIIMELKSGSVSGLIKAGVFTNDPDVLNTLLFQMLKALDYLTREGIVHRDIKPDNILYEHSEEKGYRFFLADFGLSNTAVTAETNAGSGYYMAPELWGNKAVPHTPKVDIWSLFVTLAYAANVNNFQHKIKTLIVAERIEVVRMATETPFFSRLKEMAIVDPNRRASAAFMLAKLFSPRSDLPVPAGEEVHPSSGPQTLAVNAQKRARETDLVEEQLSAKKARGSAEASGYGLARRPMVGSLAAQAPPTPAASRSHPETPGDSGSGSASSFNPYTPSSGSWSQ